MKEYKRENQPQEETAFVSYRVDSVAIDPEELELLNDKDFMKSLDRSEQEIKNGMTTNWIHFEWELCN